MGQDIMGERNRSLVGAIRWDAWHGEVGPSTAGVEVERSLGPAKYHYRAPWFARVLGPDSIIARTTSQADMDQEIAMARAAGLDYWAFVYYDQGSGLDIGINRYLSSRRKLGLKFCMIQDNIHDKALDELVKRFQLAEYLRVDGDRPLLYIYSKYICTQAHLDALYAKCRAMGISRPYIVLLTHVTEPDSDTGYRFEFDAVSAYTTFPWWPNSPIDTYSQWERDRWEHLTKKGYKVLPWVSTGFDNRPRADNTMTWVGRQDIRKTTFTQDMTPQQLARQLTAALDFNRTHPMSSPADAVLIYAWNEFDEGGWICPTLYYGADRLNGIASVLGGRRQPVRQPAFPGRLVSPQPEVWIGASSDDKGIRVSWPVRGDTTWPSGGWIELRWRRPVHMNGLVCREGASQAIRGYRVDAWVKGMWQRCAQGVMLGPFAPVLFSSVRTERLRLTWTEPVNKPDLQQIVAIDDRTRPSVPEDLQCWWKLDGDLFDWAGSRHMLPGAEPVWARDKVQGRNRQVLCLSPGWSAYVHDTNGVHTRMLDGMDRMELSVWLKIEGKQRSVLVEKPLAYRIALDNGLVRAWLGTEGLPVSADNGLSAPVPAGRWHHLTMRYDGAQFVLLMNGQIAAQRAQHGRVYRAQEMAMNLTLGGQCRARVADMTLKASLTE